LWRLGYQGDFTLEEGIEPQDWFYAQHDVNIVRSKRDGVSENTIVDNGNQRVLNASGAQCGGSTPCESRVPLLELDEKTRRPPLNGRINSRQCSQTLVGQAGF